MRWVADVLREKRLEKKRFGLNYVPDWGEHTVSLRPGDKSILKPGMTLHFMPGIWLETYGFECSEPLLITENGCENFIEFPQKLI
jgi:ectoine hydrolase